MNISKYITIELIADSINSRFNQDNYPEYNKPYNILGADVIFWECGAMVLIDKSIGQGKLIYLLGEDDGTWFLKSKENCTVYDVNWIPYIIKCLETCKDFLNIK